MKITAVIALRNEDAYLRNCLRHLVRNGVAFAIIDHSSTDKSAAIYGRSEFRSRLVRTLTLPWRGQFSLREQLECKMRLIDELDTDWVVHLDADEMMHSYRPNETLAEAIHRLAAEGANAINFDEFVFLPVDAEYTSDVDGFPQSHYYYFFEPRPERLMRAWRKTAGFSLVDGAGHTLRGGDVQLASENLALRHYMFRSQEHARVKYTTREFAAAELERGWHRKRVGFAPAAYTFPEPARLKHVDDVNERRLDRSDPWRSHYWEVCSGKRSNSGTSRTLG